MAIDAPRIGPLLNPVLTLRKQAIPESAPGGGHSEKHVVRARLEAQRRSLSSQVAQIAKLKPANLHDGKVQLLVEMFADSHAQSWAPKAMFNSQRTRATLVAPAKGGYIATAEWGALDRLVQWLKTAQSVEARVAISHTESIRVVEAKDVLGNLSTTDMWSIAEPLAEGRAFFLWLAPFQEVEARASVLSALEGFEASQQLLPTFPGVELTDGAQSRAIAIQGAEQRGLAQAMRRYRRDGAARTVAVLASEAALAGIAASGAAFRIDPVRRIEVTAPGEGVEPGPPVPEGASDPVVAVVDGGLTARSYKAVEEFRAPPLVADAHADHVHGNRIASLVVHAHAWNNRLRLPTLSCRVGTVQAVPKSGAPVGVNPEQLIAYLRRIAREYPEAKVWNLSFNQIEPEADPELVSYLGHEIAKLARDEDILPVISIGNQLQVGEDRLRGPADCEAAITVSGRGFDSSGAAAGRCPVSVSGPGPDGMLKPDLSWFSELRSIGGAIHQGSSYAATLVSSLAAHTFANLKDPSPDLVKALLFNAAELDQHDRHLGWGTPWREHHPWECEPGSVTLAWKANLTPGTAYYWQDIPIPRELVRVGRLFGRGRLVAVLKPRISEAGGPNYFATRLQVALQYNKGAGRVGNLLGTMKEDSIEEIEARTELAKWQPVRVHARDFTHRGGLSFAGDTLRLHARVYARDLFQFGLTNHVELGEQEVAFVLTLSDTTDGPGIYNSMAQRLGAFVESAVLDQNIELSN